MATTNEEEGTLDSLAGELSDKPTLTAPTASTSDEEEEEDERTEGNGTAAEEEDGPPPNTDAATAAAAATAVATGKVLRRSSSSFMRASDLELCRSLGARADDLRAAGLHQEADDHEATDENELWIAVDGERSEEVMPSVVNEMARFALSLTKEGNPMWTADRKTAKVLSKSDGAAWMYNPKEVLLWTGKFTHGGYGSDIPCVKSRGVVNMSPRDLAVLLLDSSRVKDYNKMSQGRTDEVVLQSGVDTEDGTYGPGETKIIRSANKPPLVRRVLQFVSVLHARRLLPEKGEGKGYIVVGRSVIRAEEDVTDPGDDGKQKKKSSRNEILLNVHLMLEIDGRPGTSDMININHLKSPLVPQMVAKKMGTSSAVGFINDIRALC